MLMFMVMMFMAELTILNDSGVFSLSEIADIIEESFKKNNFYPYVEQNND